MLLEMYLNELSLFPPAPSFEIGQDRVKHLVLTMRDATTRGVNRALHVPEGFFNTYISTNYSWYEWRNDKRVDRDLRLFYKTLVTKIPFFSDSSELQKIWALTDCYWQNKKALGIKAAYIADGLTLSLPSNNEWENHTLSCLVQEIVENDIQEHTEEIHHASYTDHLNYHSSWIKNRIQSNVKNGLDLWKKSPELFPLLIFCSDVEQQMNILPNESLVSISKGLFYLNLYCANWKTGTFNANTVGCRVSSESQATLQKYRQQHSFYCPDGKLRLFSLHAKMGVNWRIYFNAELNPGKLFIGHVGRHLPIVSKPT